MDVGKTEMADVVKNCYNCSFRTDFGNVKKIPTFTFTIYYCRLLNRSLYKKLRESGCTKWVPAK